MNGLTHQEATNWLPRAGLVQDQDGDVAFQTGKNLVIAVPLPEKPYRLPYLADLLLTGPSTSAFTESLLWFTDWGVGGEVSNRVGFHVLQGLYPDSRPLIELPARLFGPDERIAAQSHLVLPILMGWDAYFIPVTGRYFVFNSNDEFVDVVSNDEETHQHFLSLLKDGWGAKEWS